MEEENLVSSYMSDEAEKFRSTIDGDGNGDGDMINMRDLEDLRDSNYQQLLEKSGEEKYMAQICHLSHMPEPHTIVEPEVSVLPPSLDEKPRVYERGECNHEVNDVTVDIYKAYPHLISVTNLDLTFIEPLQSDVCKVQITIFDRTTVKTVKIEPGTLTVQVELFDGVAGLLTGPWENCGPVRVTLPCTVANVTLMGWKSMGDEYEKLVHEKACNTELALIIPYMIEGPCYHMNTTIREKYNPGVPILDILDHVGTHSRHYHVGDRCFSSLSYFCGTGSTLSLMYAELVNLAMTKT